MKNIAKNQLKEQKYWLYTKKAAVFFWLCFGVMYMFFSYDLLGIQLSTIENYKILEIFQKFSLYVGLIVAVFSLIGGYILYFIAQKWFKDFKLFYIAWYFSITLPWYIEAKRLVGANLYTDIAKGLSFYVGDPLLRTTKFMFGLLLVWFLIVLVRRFIQHRSWRVGGLTGLWLGVFVLSGCGTINEWACQFFDNPDHCYQNAAVQDDNPDTCEKIKGADFAEIGSNPPKDKCYKRIAENTGDLSECDKIQGGMYSYTKEECVKNTSIKHVLPGGCLSLSGAEKEDCVEQIKDLVMPGAVMVMDDKIKKLEQVLQEGEDPDKQAELEQLKKDRSDALEVMDKDKRHHYESITDPLNREISMEAILGHIDQQSKESLIALNDSLRAKGQTLSKKEYEALRDVLVYKNDPKNDIENMKDEDLLKLRWTEKIGKAKEFFKFWKANPTPREKTLDQQLFFYERMLERQAAIDKGLSEKQQDFDRNFGMFKDKVKGDLYDKGVDILKDAALGEMREVFSNDAESPTTAILGEALDVVKEEAKGAEFRGLVEVYNRGLEEEMAKNGGSLEDAHHRVIENLEADPYAYAEGRSFAKYTNLLENKDCDGTNPHCINRKVFWKAMKKSYKYQHSLN